MTLFLVSTIRGWGKGETLTQAINEYVKNNGELEKSFGLQIWTVESLDDVQVSNDGLNVAYKETSQKLYDYVETTNH